MDVDGWSVSAYSNYSNKDSWYADSMVSYGHNGYDLRRTIGAQSVTASPDGSSVSFATSIGRDFNKGAWDFGPYGRLQYSRISFDPFVETVSGVGPVVAQAVRTQDVDSLSTVLGGKMTYVHSTDWGVVIPHAEAEWLHEFRNDNPEVVANFVGSPLSSTIVGDPADSNVFKLGVGLSFVLTHGRSGFIYYERLEGNSRVSQQNIALGFRIEF
jgi:outer membrane autotransporter protein